MGLTIYLLFFNNIESNFFNYNNIESITYNINIISRTRRIKLYQSYENSEFNNNNIKISNIF